MRMATAHFHEIERAIGRQFHLGNQGFDLSDQYARLFAVPEFVDVLHAAAPLVLADPRSSASKV